MPRGLLGRPQAIPTPSQWSGGFDPSLVGTLTAWYDFSDSSTLTLVNGLISSITNKSGAAPTLSQSVEANRPTIGKINGRTAAEFDGANDLLQASGTVQSFGTMFVVVGQTTASDRTAAFFCRNVQSFVETMAIGTSNSTPSIMGCGGRWSGSGGVNVGQVINHSSHNAYIVSATFDRFSAPRPRVNGAAQLNVLLTVVAGNQAFIYLGARQVNASTLSYWPSTIGEVLLYPAILAGDQIFAVEQYLSKKWGVPA